MKKERFYLVKEDILLELFAMMYPLYDIDKKACRRYADKNKKKILKSFGKVILKPEEKGEGK